MWAFGITGIEVFTNGATPYKDLGTAEVIAHVKEGRVCARPPSCPPAIYKCFLRCWSLEPEKRHVWQTDRPTQLERVSAFSLISSAHTRTIAVGPAWGCDASHVRGAKQTRVDGQTGSI